MTSFRLQHIQLVLLVGVVVLITALFLAYVHLETYGIPFIHLGYRREASWVPVIKFLLNILSFVAIAGLYLVNQHLKTYIFTQDQRQIAAISI